MVFAPAVNTCRGGETPLKRLRKALSTVENHCESIENPWPEEAFKCLFEAHIAIYGQELVDQNLSLRRSVAKLLGEPLGPCQQNETSFAGCGLKKQAT